MSATMSVTMCTSMSATMSATILAITIGDFLKKKLADISFVSWRRDFIGKPYLRDTCIGKKMSCPAVSITALADVGQGRRRTKYNMQVSTRTLGVT